MANHQRVIGRYDVQELIGRGGFGSVYRATDPAHGRDVAIKVLQGTLGETERRRFDRERQAMGRLGSHSNIIPVHDSGYTEDGEAYLAMELATGGSLQDRLDASGRMPWSAAATTMVAIASAVDAAHRAGVLHRDIKPDNILIDEYGTPKLTDFGIASMANNSTATTSTSATIAHAAPEVLDGARSGEAADIYALGSTLHTLIAGTAPFYREGDHMIAAMIGRIATQPPPDLRPLGVPDAVATVIERSLAKTPAQRQASAAQLADELRAAVAGGTGAASNPSSGPTVAATAPPARSMPTAVSPPTMPGQAHPTVVQAVPQQPVERRSPVALWAVIGVLAAAIIGLVAVLLASGGSDDGSSGADSAAEAESSTTAAPTSPPSSEASTTTGPTTSTAPSTAPPTTALPTTAPPTTAPLVERDLGLGATASASSEAPAGNDACGARTTFGPANLLDGRVETAWRTGGSGVGATIEVTLDDTHLITSVGLIPGYAKVDRCDGADRFVENRRIEVVRWTVGDQVIEQRLDPDDPAMQTVRLDEPAAASSVRVVIEATTASGGRDFAAISELEILGG